MPAVRARLQFGLFAWSWSRRKATLPGRFAPKKQGGEGVGWLLSGCCAVISLDVESVWVAAAASEDTGLRVFILRRAAASWSIYLAWTALPAMMSSLNCGCHVLRRFLTSGWRSSLPSLPSLSSSGTLCVHKAETWGFLSNALLVAILSIRLFIYVAVCSSSRTFRSRSLSVPFWVFKCIIPQTAENIMLLSEQLVTGCFSEFMCQIESLCHFVAVWMPD